MRFIQPRSGWEGEVADVADTHLTRSLMLAPSPPDWAERVDCQCVWVFCAFSKAAFCSAVASFWCLAFHWS